MSKADKVWAVIGSIATLLNIWAGFWKFAAAIGFITIMSTLIGIEEQV